MKKMRQFFPKYRGGGMPERKPILGCCGEDYCGSPRCVAVVAYQAVHGCPTSSPPDETARTGSQHSIHKEHKSPFISLHTTPRWTPPKRH